jgi:hypothetical protein
MLINLDALTVDQAGMLADYVADGCYTVADWLSDQAMQCDCCGKHYDSQSDFANCDDLNGWFCDDCAPRMRAEMRQEQRHIESYRYGVL